MAARSRSKPARPRGRPPSTRASSQEQGPTSRHRARQVHAHATPPIPRRRFSTSPLSIFSGEYFWKPTGFFHHLAAQPPGHQLHQSEAAHRFDHHPGRRRARGEVGRSGRGMSSWVRAVAAVHQWAAMRSPSPSKRATAGRPPRWRRAPLRAARRDSGCGLGGMAAEEWVCAGSESHGSPHRLRQIPSAPRASRAGKRPAREPCIGSTITLQAPSWR